MKIEGKITMSLEAYEGIKKSLEHQQQLHATITQKAKDQTAALKELMQAINALLERMDNADQVVGTLNGVFEKVELRKQDDGGYRLAWREKQ